MTIFDPDSLPRSAPKPPQSLRSGFTRRAALAGLVTLPFTSGCSLPSSASPSAHRQLAELEFESQGRLGIAAWTASSLPRRSVRYRPNERFPFCSTFKFLAAAAILKRTEQDPTELDRHIRYSKQDLVSYSPITEKQAGRSMSLAQLCAAALQYSDNTAGNLLIKELGGTQAMTAFARSIGDSTFRLDRWETELNTAIPGDVRDITSPAAMAHDLQRLLLGHGLSPQQRNQLSTWMRGNTTGAARIRAAVPSDWEVADKTGSGDYGTTNDIGILFPPNQSPIILAIYFTQKTSQAPMRNDIIAAATKIVLETLTDNRS
ncbi:beta-lactamase class A [Prosthecobacter debontii]|uniref:Beta-lactamase n=1 Tax=Prosthecobacter debontii TaxID=48467 RepID=A0A1T4YQW7_9BACT|nr:class A beta-lactamase [Prosthecobacter debontii]SKB04126.1 beta-lactamase class A [Prosthecobacter debontii]